MCIGRVSPIYWHWQISDRDMRLPNNKVDDAYRKHINADSIEHWEVVTSGENSQRNCASIIYVQKMRINHRDLSVWLPVVGSWCAKTHLSFFDFGPLCQFDRSIFELFNCRRLRFLCKTSATRPLCARNSPSTLDSDFIIACSWLKFFWDFFLYSLLIRSDRVCVGFKMV